ncbi:SGNH/GDSL hydrolase family protein [Micromonospora fluostatini]|uniref:SGNH/GDSL hydrolase family protein n=1 Tax=Micromonospora sp. JCM 30529 TaxID=3421643 RepID=UPI003D1800FF
MTPTRLVATLVALLTTALPGAAEAAVGTARCAGRAPDAACPPPSPVLAGAHTAGRVTVTGDQVRYSWPGISFEGRFRGTGVGIVLDDAVNDYDVHLDGGLVATLVTPGRTTHWLTGLPDGRHTVRLVKRTESTWTAGAFGGFVPAPGGRILDPPRPRTRQIEFIGDSNTAGYGNMSTTRECTDEEVTRRTNTDLTFAARTARRLGADYQVNAYSGLGMVRNYGGHSPGTSYRTYYERALLADDGDVWARPATWRPQLVVVALGANDFSTALGPDEPWTPESLVTAYREAYHGFLDTLRARYGRATTIVVMATALPNTTDFAEAAERVARERVARGDDRIRYWYHDNAGVDLLGCHWHLSLRDHQLTADRLGAYLDTLPLRW